MNLDESGPVERKDVERAAERWAHRSYRNASSRGPEQTDKEFPRFASCFTDLSGSRTSGARSVRVGGAADLRTGIGV